MTSPTGPLRVGLIGAGGVARVHAPAWTSLGAEVSVYALDGAADLARRFGLDVVGSLEELWEQVDIVDILTPTHTHADLALAAVGRGKHVVCEKPLARTAAAARTMMAAAAEAGVGLFPAHVVRYFPAYARAHAAVQAGRIGQVAVCRFRRIGTAPRADWYFEEESSGGIVMDQMIHDLDQAQWFAGQVRRVFARSAHGAATGGRVASAAVTLEHVSGAISQCYGVWGHPGLPFSSSFHIAGDRGVLSHDSARTDAVRLSVAKAPGSGASYLPPADAAGSPYTAEIADFAEAITAGSTPVVSAADGAGAVQLAEAVLTSISTGCPVGVLDGDAGSEGSR